MTKPYLVERNGKKLIEYRTHPDKNTLGIAPDGEDAEWLQVEKVDDGSGNLVDTVTVDKTKKALKIQERLEKDLEKSKQVDKIDSIFDAVKSIKSKDINALDDIKSSIMTLKKAILALKGEIDE